MSEEGKKALTTALRIIALHPEYRLENIDEDIRPYFATAPQRGQGFVECAIQIVVKAIEGAGTQV